MSSQPLVFNNDTLKKYNHNVYTKIHQPHDILSKAHKTPNNQIVKYI